MSQNRETGKRANEYGLETARKVALLLKAEKIGPRNSNEYDLGGRRIVIKCCRTATKVGVVDKMLDRLDSIYGAFEGEEGVYDIYELSPDVFIEKMRPTASKGASSGRVNMVRKTVFIENGKKIYEKVSLQ